MSTSVALEDTSWDQIDLGAHICSIYRNKDEQFSPITPFFAHGVDKRQRCLYIFDENTPEEVSSALAIDKADTLEFVSPSDTYTKGGPFEPDTMISLLDKEIAHSLEKGCCGMRAAAEMTWALTSRTPIDMLVEYETKLNDFFPENKLTAICQFNETRFTPDFLVHMICAHPYVILYGKLYENKYFYTSPKFGGTALQRLTGDDYQTILSVILGDAPISDGR